MRFRVDIKRSVSVWAALICMLSPIASVAYAKDTDTTVAGTLYELSKDDHYEWESASGIAVSPDNAIGALKISGDIEANDMQNDLPAYMVNSDSINFSYVVDGLAVENPETEWHLIDHKTKRVSGLTLDTNMGSGAIIVQASMDRTYWSTEAVLTDAFADDGQAAVPLYTSKAIQLQNGCFYRITVAYKMQRKLEDKKILFMNMDNYEEKEVAEVYEFYAVSSESVGSTLTPNDTPRRELGKKVNTGKDNGFSGEVAIDKDDPHYGWDLGTFVINGYTSETEQNGTPVFLKNVGDKVTLWFTLQQDINALNGSGTLTIAEDTNGYDQQFEVPQTNFKHGTLIIRYTDHEGHAGEPIIYTDFLAANALTGADTKVQLFEEGDYEVTLDYEIKNDPRKIGPVSVVPSYTDYKIAFKFSIRNSNSMVFPFDISTGAELADQAVTPNGFRLDMARSRYLKIDVERAILKTGTDGLVTKDVRFNRAAKDNETYTEEGIYTFTVTNSYTGKMTTKTIYVGDNKYILALAKYNLSIEALNEKIAQGIIVEEDGTIADLTPEPVASLEPVEVLESNAPVEVEPVVQPVEPTIAPSNIASEDPDNAEKAGGASFPILFAAIGVLVAGGALALVKKGKKEATVK